MAVISESLIRSACSDPKAFLLIILSFKQRSKGGECWSIGVFDDWKIGNGVGEVFFCLSITPSLQNSHNLVI
jgi:hypothetical protein